MKYAILPKWEQYLVDNKIQADSFSDLMKQKAVYQEIGEELTVLPDEFDVAESKPEGVFARF